jgi:hypothetical protein
MTQCHETHQNVYFHVAVIRINLVHYSSLICYHTSRGFWKGDAIKVGRKPERGFSSIAFSASTRRVISVSIGEFTNSQNSQGAILYACVCIRKLQVQFRLVLRVDYRSQCFTHNRTKGSQTVRTEMESYYIACVTYSNYKLPDTFAFAQTCKIVIQRGVTS